MIHCRPSVPSATSGPRRSIIVTPILGPELKGGGRPFLAGSRGISARGATGVPPTPPEGKATAYKTVVGRRQRPDNALVLGHHAVRAARPRPVVYQYSLSRSRVSSGPQSRRIDPRRSRR